MHCRDRARARAAVARDRFCPLKFLKPSVFVRIWSKLLGLRGLPELLKHQNDFAVDQVDQVDSKKIYDMTSATYMYVFKPRKEYFYFRFVEDGFLDLVRIRVPICYSRRIKIEERLQENSPPRRSSAWKLTSARSEIGGRSKMSSFWLTETQKCSVLPNMGHRGTSTAILVTSNS